MGTLPIAKYFTRPLSLEKSLKTVEEKHEYQVLYSIPEVIYCYTSIDASYVIIALPHSQDPNITQLFYFDKYKTCIRFCLTDDNKFSTDIFVEI